MDVTKSALWHSGDRGRGTEEGVRGSKNGTRGSVGGKEGRKNKEKWEKKTTSLHARATLEGKKSSTGRETTGGFPVLSV